MAIRHVVEQGECISSIAARYKVNWQVLWDHPDNDKLKQLRKHPGILQAGDVVVVPSKEKKRMAAAQNRRHQFVLRTTDTLLCLRFTCNDQPIKNEAYRLAIDGAAPLEGSTDGDGKIEVPIRGNAREAQLTFPKRNEQHRLRLGTLPPIDSVAGQQVRLHQLGFYPDEPDGNAGPLLELALRAFQSSQKLTESGQADDPTLQALAKVFCH